MNSNLNNKTLDEISSYVNERMNVNELNNSTYISTENMLPNKAGITDATTLPNMNLTSAFKMGDVLVSNIRPYFKKIWQATFDGGCSNDVLVFRAKDGTDSKYLYYVLSNDKFFDYSMSTSKGTKMPRGDKKSLMEYSVPDINTETQRKIAKVLSAIDDKIELNNSLNNNLEQQIQSIFKRNFIDSEYIFVKDTTIGDICKCELGGTPSRTKPEYWNGNVAWINSGEVNKFRITKPSEYITDLGLSKSATKLLPKKTTVLAITGATLGQISLLEIDSCTNQSVVGIIENDTLPYEFIYPYVVNNIKELISHQTGGAQQHINKQNIESLKLLLPDNEIINNYKKLVKPLFETISNNCFENESLIQLRDTLLSKLMSGEIDVTNVKLR